MLTAFIKISIGKKIDLTSKENKITTHQEKISIPKTLKLSISDTLKLQSDSLRRFENENAKLKNKIENLKDEIAFLKIQYKNQNERYSALFVISPFLLYTLLIVFTLLTLTALFFFYPRIADKIKSLFMKNGREQKELTRISKTQSQSTLPQGDNLKQTTIVKISNEPKSFSNILRLSQKKTTNTNDWFVVSASAIGKLHLTSNSCCQDNHYCENIGYGWGIAISCDGAGSAQNSHLGSEFVAKETLTLLKKYITRNNYHKKNILPFDHDWRAAVSEIFTQIRKQLEKFTRSKNVEFASAACTVIIVIYSPIGFLVAHIGDGRAGYCNVNGEWNSMMTPHKGEESNETIFISSNNWQNENNFVMSGVSVPECMVIRERPIAFTLLSDGCEAHSFECSKMDQVTNKWHDPNIPFSKFFNPLVTSLKGMYENKVPIDKIDTKWRTFVEEGTPGLKEESDDKTLIMGVLM